MKNQFFNSWIYSQGHREHSGLVAWLVGWLVGRLVGWSSGVNFHSGVPSRVWTYKLKRSPVIISCNIDQCQFNRIMHHAPFTATPNHKCITCNWTDQWSRSIKTCLALKTELFSFFTDSYTKSISLTIFRPSGKSSDDERKVKPIYLADFPVPCPKKISAVHAGTQLCWLLMLLRDLARMF